MKLPATPKRCLAIAMLRVAELTTKDAARTVRCANDTVVEVERWFRGEDYHAVASICDDESIKRMVSNEAVYWGLDGETLVKLDRITQVDILGHYRGMRAFEARSDQTAQLRDLPTWVSQAQREHLEREERHDELGLRIGKSAYPAGGGVRQKLEFFRSSFPDIDPRHESFWHPLDEDMMAQLHGHLPDEAFWEEVEGSEGFAEKAKRCKALMDASRESFTLAGEELAPLQSPSEPLPDTYITLGWARRVLARSLDPQLGFQVPGKYYCQDLPDGRVMLYDMEPLYLGRAHKKAEKKHRELAECFAQSERFEEILTLMKQLRDLRQQILARIDKCLRKGEYVLSYCPDCPAEQARESLISEGSS